ncbi:MAG TPA: hypothetical protein PKJ33_02895 [Alphaproteobacteria bacterium]|nr:hypothetical protein [Alphaproteobacteria bacterium]
MPIEIKTNLEMLNSLREKWTKLKADKEKREKILNVRGIVSSSDVFDVGVDSFERSLLEQIKEIIADIYKGRELEIGKEVLIEIEQIDNRLSELKDFKVKKLKQGSFNNIPSSIIHFREARKASAARNEKVFSRN